jgi:hypothetical protein
VNLRFKRLPKISVFDSINYQQRFENYKDPRTNTDNETNRFGSGECVVPLPTQAQQAERFIRDVLPQPVDVENSSVADRNNDSAVAPENKDSRQGEGVALPLPGRSSIKY